MNLPLPGFLKGNGNRRTGGYGDNPGKLPPLGHDGPRTLMAIMAHPDDIDFGSSGSVAKWCAEGWTVYYVLVTSGDKGTHDAAMGPQQLAAMREEEQRAAARALGVKEVFFLGYPDGWVVPTHELRGEIVRLFRTYKPEIVLTWDGFRTSFNHVDHRNVGIAVRDAVFPATRDHLYYPEHSAEGLAPEHRVNEMLLVGSDKPDYFVDVSDYLEQKADAILSHASQVQSHDRDELLKRMRTQGRRRGGRGTVESFRRVVISRSQRSVQAEKASQAAAGANGSQAQLPATEGSDTEATPVGAGT
ncbi:MAG TPA: PIG-L deacetylase family protein [Dehalococcoidia bacterium]|nr:PIG-L deacetylase family protein [Dehalococcoidia bacterium]